MVLFLMCACAMKKGEFFKKFICFEAFINLGLIGLGIYLALKEFQFQIIIYLSLTFLYVLFIMSLYCTFTRLKNKFNKMHKFFGWFRLLLNIVSLFGYKFYIDAYLELDRYTGDKEIICWGYFLLFGVLSIPLYILNCYWSLAIIRITKNNKPSEDEEESVVIDLDD